MGAPLDYRNAVPDLSSSSPLQTMASMSSSPPLSPQSPTPIRGSAFRSPTSSNPHPFSGSAKAMMGSHPSFGRDQLRSKHVRGSPEKAAAAGHQTWALSAGPRGPTLPAKEDTLQQHFYDSSDDNPSSDGVTSWAPESWRGSSVTAESSLQSAPRNVGLGIEGDSHSGPTHSVGLGRAFQESSSPSTDRKARVRTFSRTQSSSTDPFCAGAGSSMPHDALHGSPSRTLPKAQRRRLTGSSPKKLSRATQMSRSGNYGSSDEELAPWEETLSSQSGVDWNSVVEQVFDRIDGNMELSRQGLTRIDPVIADLAKFVSIAPLRRNESRRTSTTLPFERSASSSSHFGSPNSRSRSSIGDQNSSSKLLLYLAGNRLDVFPSALFELHNLSVLSIRDNNLEELPPAIGQLVNLRELNVSQNRLKYLPAEMQKLRLDSFTHFPNPFLLPPANAALTTRPVLGVSSGLVHGEEVRPSTGPPSSMGPPAVPLRLQSHSRLALRTSFAHQAAATPVNSTGDASHARLARCLPGNHYTVRRLPSLVETCIRVLLEPEEDEEGGKMLLEQYESGCLVNLNKNLDASIIKSLEAARRSGVKAWGRIRPSSSQKKGTWCSGTEIKGLPTTSGQVEQAKSKPKSGKIDLGHSSSDLLAEHFSPETEEGEASSEWSPGEEKKRQRQSRMIDVEEELDRGDDSKRNPWFNRCPNPRHYNSNSDRTTLQTFDWPGPLSGGLIFSKPGAQQLEWVSHVAGVPVTQIRLEDVMAVQDTETPVLAHGSSCIPLQWRGCGPSCLDFLS